MAKKTNKPTEVNAEVNEEVIEKVNEKVEKTIKEKMKTLDSLSKKINDKAKKVLCGRLCDNKDLLNKLTIGYIETPSINLNAAMGGGIPRNRCTIISGVEDSGKTFLLLETISKNMKENPNFLAAWFESEKSLTLQSIIELFDIDPNRFFFYEIERDGAAEVAIDTMEAVLATNTVDILVINSLKCLVPKKEYNDKMEDINVGIQARQNSKMQRKFTSLVGESNAAFVMITHLTSNIGDKYNPLIISGGKAIAYWSVMTLDVRKASISEKEDPVDKENHMKVCVKIKKNHCSVMDNPYKKVAYYVEYGKGIMVDLEIMQNAIDQGVVGRSGAWISELGEDGEPFTLSDGTKAKWCGFAKFKNYLNANKEYFNHLKGLVAGKADNMSEEEITEAKEEEKEEELAAREEDNDFTEPI